VLQQQFVEFIVALRFRNLKGGLTLIILDIETCAIGYGPDPSIRKDRESKGRNL
jgi:hypothetical protein